MFLGQIFTKNAKNDPKTLFEASKWVKKYNSENYGKVPKWREKCLFFFNLVRMFAWADSRDQSLH